MNRKKIRKVCVQLILPCLIGVFTFLILYGFTPLNVRNDSWIMAGYDEADIIQHYSGWIAFRNSEWTFPLGMARDMACEDGTYISFTDSIPWVSIAFKTFRDFLPETFQFFGLYTLFCYMMQGVAAFHIIYWKCKDSIYAIIGTILYTFSPIVMERAFRHTALGSQWLILLAILVYMVHRDRPSRMHYMGYLLLLVLAIGIHPYFLPMIAIFLLLSVIEDIGRKEFWPVIFSVAILSISFACGIVLGVLGTGVTLSRDGYGKFSMNLNALINPVSIGGYTWSSFVKKFPQILGNYDGFNYLGLGIISGIFFLFVLTVFLGKERVIWEWIKQNVILLLALICCFIFAVSNVVTYNDIILANVALPEWLYSFCGIFRASSRLFYPVYYCIFTGVILGIWLLGKKASKKRRYLILGMILLIQLLDMNVCIAEKHEKMLANAEYVSILDDAVLDEILESNQFIILDNYSGDTRTLAVAALKNNLKLYYSTANSGNYSNTAYWSNEIAEHARKTGEIDPYIIVTSESAVLQNYLQHENIGCYEAEDSWYIYSLDTIASK